MKPSEARNLSPDEIAAEVDKRREELLDLRFQASVGQANNPKRIRTAKREIARLLTVANEKVSESVNGNANRSVTNPRERGGA